jgi:hypothetical protein
VSPYTGLVPPSSRPVRNRCMRTRRAPVGSPAQAMSVTVWYVALPAGPASAGSGGNGESDERKPRSGWEKSECTSAALRTGCVPLSAWK